MIYYYSKLYQNVYVLIWK